jgi:hypothetical protein
MDMIAPLFKAEAFGLHTSMVVAFALGFLFGTALEKAGFGSGRKLTAQFYLHDWAVFKVMFSAVATALVLTGAAVAFGLMDFGALFIPATIVWPQVVGGLLLGVGFVVGGYCPGTSMVSVASGRIDGMVYVLGFFAGLFLFPLAFPALEGLYNAGNLGVVTLFDVIPLPMLAVSLLVAALAVASFVGATWVEKWAARRWPSLHY